ncbi:hypothetical protein MXB_5451, partial [Myxobolus squamalis]
VSKSLTMDSILLLLYHCIDVQKCASDDIIDLCLSILSDNIVYEKFRIRFFQTHGILRLCCIPHSLSSSFFTLIIFTKISEMDATMIYLIKNDIKNIECMIKYLHDSLSISPNEMLSSFILNLSKYPKCVEIFRKNESIIKILKLLKEMDIFEKMKQNRYSYSDIDEYYEEENVKINQTIKIILCHVFIQVYSLLSIEIKNSFPKFDVLSFLFFIDPCNK